MESLKDSQNDALPLAIITGAARGIGKAAAELLCLQKAYDVILVVRNAQLGKTVETELRKSWPRVHSVTCSDLGSFTSVEKLHKEIQEEKFPKYPIKILINCAAECPNNQILKKRLRKKSNDLPDSSEELVDAQFSSNVLAYHFMIKTFFQNMNSISEESYIVNVASNWAGDVDLKDFSFIRRGYDNDSAYRQSKALNRMLTKQWSDFFQSPSKSDGSCFNPKTIHVNSCHPGDPCTKLSTALGYNLYASKDCRSSCKSILSLATQADSSGGWYEADESKIYCVYMSDTFKKERQILWDICESFAVLK